MRDRYYDMDAYEGGEQKGFVDKIVDTCQGAVLTASNWGVTALMLISMGLRYGHCFDSDIKPDGFKGFFFLIENTYYLIGILLFACSILPDSIKVKQMVLTYFYFLDYDLGRGFLILFMSFYMIEVGTFL